MPSIDDFLKEDSKKPRKTKNTISIKSPLKNSDEQKEEPRPWNMSIKELQNDTEKPTTKLQQTYNKVTIKPTTNLQQSYNKVTTEKAQSEETYNKLTTELTTEVTTKLQQSYNKVTTNLAFSSLVGLQQKILIFIYQMGRISGSRMTEKITIQYLSQSCETTVRSAQETIRRLITKGFLERKSFKNGRSGWTIYELPKEVYNDILNHETYNKLTTNLQQTPNKLTTEPTTELTTSPPSSSSNIYSKTTTTNNNDLENKNHLSEQWEQIAFEELAPIGFTKTHLKQLSDRGKLSLEEVQNSIHAFAFDLKHKNKAEHIKKTPLEFFMGILAKGPYAFPDGYESPEDKVRREYLQSLRKKREEQDKLTKEIQDLEFQNWLDTLSADERKEITPDVLRKSSPDSAGVQASLKNYYLENIWPQKEKDMQLQQA